MFHTFGHCDQQKPEQVENSPHLDDVVSELQKNSHGRVCVLAHAIGTAMQRVEAKQDQIVWSETADDFVAVKSSNPNRLQ